MKYNLVYIIFIILFQFTNSACNKADLNINDTPPSDSNPLKLSRDTLNVHWMVRHNQSDAGKNFSFKPILYKDLLIFSSDDLYNGEPIFGLDVETRELIWQWEEYLGQSYGEKPWLINMEWEQERFISNNLFCVTNKAIYSINALTGKTSVSYLVSKEEQKFRFGSVQNNALVQGIDLELGKSAILLCDDKLSCRNIYSDSVPANHDIHFSNPRFDLETSPDDSLLYFGVEIRNKAKATKYRDIKFISYSITDQEIQWVFNVPRELDAKVYSQHKRNPPLIVDNLIFFQLQTHMYCLDIHTGRELWQYSFADGVGVGSKLKVIHDGGRLYFADSRGDVSCLDAHTGRRLWFNSNSNETGGAVDDIVLYNNKLYMTDLVSLTVVDALSGKGIGKFISPNAKYFRDAQINAVTIDEENEIMYVDDGYYIMACEIPGH